ncbi:flagellar basal body P-ring formation chaperone FlgA [Thalassospira lucentensis]|uniref:flagellar basal body P-ring formation chaperone FlgA n=1 Tax=Thalassospira lucentensis TaxID=168935 RepID=UPI0020CA47B5|nr:flagellar basal body P-ring formation chaperone FlgA [Thalassospira lucentensis]
MKTQKISLPSAMTHPRLILGLVLGLMLGLGLGPGASDALAQNFQKPQDRVSRNGQQVEENILLKPDALVDGQYITLGDIFSGIDPTAEDIAVAHAPQPGKQVVLDYRWLYGIAQRNSISWRPRTTADQVTITRASQVITMEEIQEAVQDALTQHGVQRPFAVDLSSENFQIHLPVDAQKRIDITGLDINSRTNRFVASVTTGAQTAQKRTYRISGKYYPLSSVPVLVEPISRGSIIRPDQVEYRDFRTERVPSGAIRDINDVIGKEVIRPTNPNEPLMFRDLTSPILVRRGALVIIRLVTANMSLTARGKALENGSKGDVIRVVNQSSNKTVQVEVVGENDVRALPAMSQ